MSADEFVHHEGILERGHTLVVRVFPEARQRVDAREERREHFPEVRHDVHDGEDGDEENREEKKWKPVRLHGPPGYLAQDRGILRRRRVPRRGARVVRDVQQVLKRRAGREQVAERALRGVARVAASRRQRGVAVLRADARRLGDERREKVRVHPHPEEEVYERGPRDDGDGEHRERGAVPRGPAAHPQQEPLV